MLCNCGVGRDSILRVSKRAVSRASDTGVTGEDGTGGSSPKSGGGRLLGFALLYDLGRWKDVAVAVAGAAGRLKDALCAGAEGGDMS